MLELKGEVVMLGNRFSSRLVMVLTMVAVTFLGTSSWAATSEVALHSFGNGTDGAYPTTANLIFDAAGNLYGTTRFGGIHAAGTVFEMSPNGGGGWTETVLHSFGHGTDGAYPAAGLVLDAAGNLYGTTQGGGIHSCAGSSCGTVFELSPNGSGGWTETVLHNFGNGTDGTGPTASLIFDASGNLYGTTDAGGIHGAGTVFEMSLIQGVGWRETVLHSFGHGTDGALPFASLTLDATGNLFGTTLNGGTHTCAGSGCGTVFELSPNGSGWTETVLYSFGSSMDGIYPYASLIMDAAGNLYGTTQQGGTRGFGGTVFELSPNGGGWTETVLYSFGLGSDGYWPLSNLTFDAAGNLYGTTKQGGTHISGTAFELSPNGSGGWAETLVHSFSGSPDGNSPYSGLIFDAAGNLYGTTYVGGIHSRGVVFEITP
jgi:uncharacterized repeat protein (TIGR03803 family)